MRLTALVQASPADKESLAVPLATAQPRAERLVAEYLRKWGLRDPQTIAALSNRWVSLAVASLGQNETCVVRDLYRAVMRRAINDMESWLEHLTGEVSRGRRYAKRGLLAIELQSLIDHCPTALLGRGSFPPALRQRLASAAVPVVPPTSPTRMPVQSLEPVTLDYIARGRQMWTRLCQRVGLTVAAQSQQG